MWLLSTVSFLPTVAVCLSVRKQHYALVSLVVLFVSQASIFVFSNPTWGIAAGHDPINDFHIASVIYESAHFQLGHVGYATMLSYSYYPLIHLFAVLFSKLSALPLSSIALYGPPFLNAGLVAFSLFLLDKEFFGLGSRARHLAVLMFATNWYYTSFQSGFVRETYAFPFALLTLVMANRIVKRPRWEYTTLFLAFFLTVTLSHFFSSYILFAILVVIALGYRFSSKKNNLLRPLTIAGVVLLFYTSFVALDYAVRQGKYVIEGLQALFTRNQTISVLSSHAFLTRYLAFSYYVIILLLVLVGGIFFLMSKNQRRKTEVFALCIFCVSFFLLSVVLRLSTSADAWSFTYYMSLRGTIWAFLGISFLISLGLSKVFKLDEHVTSKAFAAIMLIVLILSMGKFAQYSLLISDTNLSLPLDYSKYVASYWLKSEALHGSNLLVASDKVNFQAFETARSMAPYAYLKEYFLASSTYSTFKGYIAFVDPYYEEYRSERDVNIVYSNGEVDIGLRH